MSSSFLKKSQHGITKDNNNSKTKRQKKSGKKDKYKKKGENMKLSKFEGEENVLVRDEFGKLRSYSLSRSSDGQLEFIAKPTTKNKKHHKHEKQKHHLRENNIPREDLISQCSDSGDNVNLSDFEYFGDNKCSSHENACNYSPVKMDTDRENVLSHVRNYRILVSVIIFLAMTLVSCIGYSMFYSNCFLEQQHVSKGDPSTYYDTGYEQYGYTSGYKPCYMTDQSYGPETGYTTGHTTEYTTGYKTGYRPLKKTLASRGHLSGELYFNQIQTNIGNKKNWKGKPN